MSRLRLVVVGTLANDPYAGMAWMHMQIAGGLLRLGHDVNYVEATSTWPYDPVRQQRVGDSDYAVPYLARVAEWFGLGDRWAYRRSYSDKAWLGPRAARRRACSPAPTPCSTSPAPRAWTAKGWRRAAWSISGPTPCVHEIAYERGDPRVAGRSSTPTATSSRTARTSGPRLARCPPCRGCAPARASRCCSISGSRGDAVAGEFTTVGNWKQAGLDVEFRGERYLWSKHHEFLKVLGVPLRVPGQPIELATNLGETRAPNSRRGRGGHRASRRTPGACSPRTAGGWPTPRIQHRPARATAITSGLAGRVHRGP